MTNRNEKEEDEQLINYDEDFDGPTSYTSSSSIPAIQKSTSSHPDEYVKGEQEKAKDKDVQNDKGRDEDRDRGYVHHISTTNKRLTLPSASNNNALHNTSGLYIPPRKRRQIQKLQKLQTLEKNKESFKSNNDPEPVKHMSVTEQREKWEILKKDIHGTINRLNVSTMKPLLTSLFQKTNLIRGRGILTRTLLRAATTSPSFAHIYAAFISVINTKLPEIGELLLSRSILAFRRYYRRKEKRNAMATCIFLGHLMNQTVAHELLGLQILAVLLDGDPTDDSVEMAIQLTQTIGKLLSEVSPSGLHAILERFRALLQEGLLSSRIQYQLEQLFLHKKRQWEGFPILLEELDLVEKEDQITFELGLDDDHLNKEEILDVFREDPDWEENELVWKQIQDEILGTANEDEGDSDSDSDDENSNNSNSNSNNSKGESETEDSDSDADSDKEDKENPNSSSTALVPTMTQTVEDLSESDLIHLRRTIYLTIMSSATFEECSHKLAKTNIPNGRESELINMLIECCSQERTFLRYYAMISARFCILHSRWKHAFEESLASQYSTIHRLETNKLRNVAKLFAHLFHTNSLSWDNLNMIRLNEDETTSSSRIFIKILLQEMAEAMGMLRLKQELEQAHLEGMFPMNVEKPRDTRFAINFFTSIGLGPLTDGLREFLKNAPKLILAQAEARKLKQEQEQADVASTSSSELSSSSSSSSGSYTSSYDSSSSGSYSYESRRRRQTRPRNKRSSKQRRRSYSSSSNSSKSTNTGSYTSSSSYTSYSRSPSSKPRRTKNSTSRHSSSNPKKKYKKESSPPLEITATDPNKDKNKDSRKSYSRSISPLREDNHPTDRKSESSKRGDSSNDSKKKERRSSRSSSDPKHSRPIKEEEKDISKSSPKSNPKRRHKKENRDTKSSSSRPYSRSSSRSHSRSRSSSVDSKQQRSDQSDNKSSSHSHREKSKSRSRSSHAGSKSRLKSKSNSKSLDHKSKYESISSDAKHPRDENQESSMTKNEDVKRRRTKN